MRLPREKERRQFLPLSLSTMLEVLALPSDGTSSRSSMRPVASKAFNSISSNCAITSSLTPLVASCASGTATEHVPEKVMEKILWTAHFENTGFLCEIPLAEFCPRALAF